MANVMRVRAPVPRPMGTGRSPLSAATAAGFRRPGPSAGRLPPVRPGRPVRPVGAAIPMASVQRPDRMPHGLGEGMVVGGIAITSEFASIPRPPSNLVPRDIPRGPMPVEFPRSSTSGRPLRPDVPYPITGQRCAARNPERALRARAAASIRASSRSSSTRVNRPPSRIASPPTITVSTATDCAL